tara:strand:+ start:18830 stop:19345 length:516 start_codon:yes stop_codon:yes gene_type:complete
VQRIYFLVPSLEISRSIVAELKQNGLEEKHIHILGASDVSLDELPEATLLQKSDFLPAIERGIPLGAFSGLLAGLVALAVPGGIVVGGGALLVCMAAGALVGSLMGSMVALDIPNSRHRDFQQAIETGQFLMLVDTPKKRVEEIETLILTHHPDAELERVEARILAEVPAY